MSVMSTPVVFSSVRGFLAQTFVDQLPSHVNKTKFFEKTCKDHNITLKQDSANNLYSFDGLWSDFLCVEDFLQKCLIDWYSSKSTSDKNDSHTVCQQIEEEIVQNPLTESSDTAQTNSVLGSEITAERPVSTGDQHDKNTGDRGDQDKLNYVSNDKGGSDHENEIYMDIQLSCRPSNGLFKDSGIIPVTVVMGSEDSLLETICLESTNNEQAQFDHVAQSATSQKDCDTIDDWKKNRSRKYEEKAQFKFFCTQCSFKSKRQSHLKKHALLHERVCKLYSCEYCDFSTIRLGHLQRHVSQHSELQFTCPDCNYKTHSISLLKKHENLKHKKVLPPVAKPVLQCSKCTYSTTKEKLFQRHQSVHTDTKPPKKGSKNYFECNKCSFKTTLKSNLARHTKNVHMKDRPFVCTVCGQGFKRSDTLSQHLVVHAGSNSSMKELQCPHCQKFYRSKTLLHEHILAHSDTRSYLCEICGAAFKTRAVQRKHVRYVHSSSKSFHCELCSKKLNSSFAVKRHMKLHESKTAASSSKSSSKAAESTGTGSGASVEIPAVTDQWESSVMTLPIPEDVQVLVVQQEDADAEQGVIFNEGTIFVQDSAEVQMETSSDPSKAVHVPVLPVEYVLPDEVASQVCATDLSNQFSIQDGQVITLEFVE